MTQAWQQQVNVLVRNVSTHLLWTYVTKMFQGATTCENLNIRTANLFVMRTLHRSCGISCSAGKSFGESASGFERSMRTLSPTRVGAKAKSCRSEL